MATFKHLKAGFNELVIEHIISEFADYDVCWCDIGLEEARELMMDYTLEEGFFFFYLSNEGGHKKEVSYNFDFFQFHFYMDDVLVHNIDLPKDEEGLLDFLKSFDYDFVEGFDFLSRFNKLRGI